MSIITQDNTHDPSTSTINSSISNFTPEQLFAVIWDKNSGELYWCIGCYMVIDEYKICFDHLQMTNKCYDHKDWPRSHVNDVQDVAFGQVILVDVECQGDFRKRQPIYVLQNYDTIDAAGFEIQHKSGSLTHARTHQKLSTRVFSDSH